MDYAALVDEAIKQFYSNGSNNAHSWLLRMRDTPEAWTFVWQLLEPTKSWEVQFYAATTLHAKITKQWTEVPSTEYPELRQRLLSAIRQPGTPKFVVVKLCQALAGFLAKSCTVNNDNQKCIIEELVEILPYTSPDSLELLLHVLTMLPREYDHAFKTWWKTTWLLCQIFSICRPNSENYNEELYLLTLECTLSWLRAKDLPDNSYTEVTGSLYPYLLEAAPYYAPRRDTAESENSEGWEVVQECLVLLLSKYELLSKPKSVWEWTKKLISMAITHNTKYFCEIIAAVGENACRLLLSALVRGDNEEHKWIAECVIRLLLECTEQNGRYPTEETRSSIPFTFWFELQDSVNTLDNAAEEKQALVVLKPVFTRLAQALLKKTQLPSTPAEAGDADERELFRCYRQDVADTFLYCHNILKGELLFLLGQRLSQPLNSPEKWTEVEAVLHAFGALSDGVGDEIYEGNNYMPALMELVLSHVPYDLYPGEVLASACSALGAYGEWLAEHPDPYLDKALRVLSSGLTRGDVTTPFAIMALKDITRDCNSLMAPYAPTLLNVIGDMLPQVKLGSGHDLRLIYIAARLVNTLPSEEQQSVYLNATIGMCITKIRGLLEQPLFVARDEMTNQLRLAAKFGETLESPIGKRVIDILVSVFNQIIQHPEWSQDNATLEAMFDCAKKTVSTLRYPEFDAQALFSILLTSYKKWPHPEALDFLRLLMLALGKVFDNVVTPIFAEISSITLSGIRACRSVRGDIADWTDLMEAYLLLLTHICKRNVRMILNVAPQIPEMIQCGIDCLMFVEPGTQKAAGSFLFHAVMQNSEMQPHVQPFGQEIISAVVRCIGGLTPRHKLTPHADVVLALSSTWPQLTGQWLNTALQEKIVMTPAARNLITTFVQKVLRIRRNKWRIFTVVSAFSLEYRQLIMEPAMHEKIMNCQ